MLYISSSLVSKHACAAVAVGCTPHGILVSEALTHVVENEGGQVEGLAAWGSTS